MEGAAMVPPSEADVWCLWRPTACPYVSWFRPSFFSFLPFSFWGWGTCTAVPTGLTQINSQPRIVLVPTISYLIGQHSTVAYPILSGSSTSASLKIFSGLVDLILCHVFSVLKKWSRSLLCSLYFVQIPKLVGSHSIRLFPVFLWTSKRQITRCQNLVLSITLGYIYTKRLVGWFNGRYAIPSLHNLCATLFR